MAIIHQFKVLDDKTTTSRQMSVVRAIAVLQINRKRIKVFLPTVRMDSSEGNNKNGWKTSKISTIEIETPFFGVQTLKVIF